jgi:hypothetical protein
MNIGLNINRHVGLKGIDMTHKEALTLALEALKDNQHLVADNERHLYVMEYNGIIEKCEKALAQPERDLKPRCFADFQPNHEHDRKCQWCAVETECKTGVAQPSGSVEHSAPHVEPVVGTKTWFEDGKLVTQHLTAKDIYKDPEQSEQEPFGWYSAQEDEFMTHKLRKEHEQLNSYTHKVGKFDLALYTTPPTQCTCSQRQCNIKPLTEWIDPNDKTQERFLPNIGEPVLFCHSGSTYFGKHTGGSFKFGAGVTSRHFNTWECHWMPLPASHGIKE